MSLQLNLDKRYYKNTEQYAKEMLKDVLPSIRKSKERTSDKKVIEVTRSIAKLLYIMDQDGYGYAGVSMDSNYFTTKNSPSYSYLVDILPLLHQAGWIRFNKKEQVNMKECEQEKILREIGLMKHHECISTIKRGDKWKAIFKNKPVSRPASVSVPSSDELVQMRTKVSKGKYVYHPLPKSSLTDEIITGVEGVNEYLASVVIRDNRDERLYLRLRRIFGLSYEQGGRWYDLGNNIQNLSKGYRKQLTIDNEPCVELDFSACQYRMIADLVGHILTKDFDPYLLSIDGVDRSIGKQVGSILLNTSSRRGAYLAIYKHIENLPEGVKAKDLVNSFIKRNSYASEYMCFNRGMELQRVDSDIVYCVLTTCKQQGISLYPIHDSFLCKRKDVEVVRDIMLQSWESVLQSHENCLIKLED